MTPELTSIQLEKIRLARKYLNSSNDADSLYHVVVLLGPSFIGSLIGSNSETIWSRIEDPKKFKYGEMEILSTVFEVSLERFQNRISKQIEYNLEALENDRPIGRHRYRNIGWRNKVKGVKRSKKSCGTKKSKG